MANIEKAITVEAPLSAVYNQWTQFESFPQFMHGVKEVRQLDDKHVHWRAEIGGKEKEWDAEITQQIPDERIGWRSIDGTTNAGSVSFRPLGTFRTQVTLRLDYDPEGIAETVADAIGIISTKVAGDLDRFKNFIESRGTETGAWRGEIENREIVKRD